jgi:hypothetical protein
MGVLYGIAAPAGTMEFSASMMAGTSLLSVSRAEPLREAGLTFFLWGTTVSIPTT